MRALRKLLALIAASAVMLPSAFACSVCYGEPDSATTRGLSWAIIALAGIIGAVLGYLGTSILDGAPVIGALVGAIAAVLSTAVVSDVIAGAQRRGGTAALAVITVFAALVIAIICLLFPFFAIIPAAFLVFLAWRRRQQADRKHAGLRVLR